MLRALFFYIIVPPWSVLCMFLGLIFGILPRMRWFMLWIGQAVWSRGMFFLAGSRVEIVGHPDVIQKGQTYVIVSNHQGYLDVPACFISLPIPIRFLVKKEILYVPFLGLYLLLIGMLYVDRKRRDKALLTMKKQAEKIRSGNSVLIYPEGTRSKDGDVAPFKRGAFILAIEAGVPILPITLSGSYDILNRNRWALLPGKVRVHIGKPISTEGLAHEDRFHLTEKTRDQIRDTLKTL